MVKEVCDHLGLALQAAKPRWARRCRSATDWGGAAPRSHPAGSEAVAGFVPEEQRPILPPRFSERRPVPLGPDRNHEFIALLGTGGGALHAKTMCLAGASQITRVIAHPELTRDQGCDAREVSARGGKARGHRTSV